jgi:hypothetical protein
MGAETHVPVFGIRTAHPEARCDGHPAVPTSRVFGTRHRHRKR